MSKTTAEPHIHPTAIIEEGAQLAEGVSVGAYAYIGAEVKLGAGTVIAHHATIEGYTQMGRDNQVFPYAYIGAKTHDLKFKGGNPGLKIGDRNVFREYTNVHLATNDEEFTVVGNDNVILAYSHIAHDCIIGDRLVMSSHSALGGHVVVGDHVVVGWGVGVHQFCRLGAHVMVGACSKVVQDVPPYMIVDGNPGEVRTINKVGLERRGFTADQIELIRGMYRLFYRQGLNRSQALEQLRAHEKVTDPLVAAMLEFTARSDRGFS
ncbi:acyl-ACP--UDP-N-acetylglucosamine O-acyltransferase [Ruficoccus sp. ZRK36]|uniref:acyl-ACP--UDP-N-acetylglucosamine O-acyltransferase n=1 Tax=Ruficoccus sp. ZRK36 TaxID=2866311 RepID=UPI001C73CD15|nr:acyl-ACP--UDP-N-acetylglucosamine O-acyltransferase [Ruficoccus sp. ZRK36]QYY35963.1 acyl-ACP--UDP-N-acetylglucosamine O-acyltransferase [Ruficoccus sp. ZRK36]